MKLDSKQISFRDQISQVLENYHSKDIYRQLQDIDYEDDHHYNDLVNFLTQRQSAKYDFPNHVDALIYEYVYKVNKDLLTQKLPNGLLSLNLVNNGLYLDLEQLLIEKNFLDADILTQKKLIQLADIDNREWLYFSDIKKIPSEDLIIIDKLWSIYSSNKFGFSIQRNLWLSVNKDWSQLWKNIGWEIDNKMCRYPNEFIWDTTAPKGHLPLFNQLRGIQVLSALFNHPVWGD